MTWLLLFALTVLVVLLPMLPAIAEWYRPTDVTPLHIDTQDALDPPFLARSFATRLEAAVSAGQAELGSTPIAYVPAGGRWPLRASEGRAARSERIWHVAGAAELPSGISFTAEVMATGDLRSAPQGAYGALWSGQTLHLAALGSVLRWAHGARVDVQPGCKLGGRVSADESITVCGDLTFALLHAPQVRFAHPQGDVAGPAWSGPSIFPPGLAPPVVWDLVAGRGTCSEALAVGARRAWNGDLVCAADLWLGAGCHATGSLKARGDLVVDEGCRVSGSVFAEGLIRLGPRCRVLGSVVSETEIVLGAGCLIGAPGHPATVAAPRITVALGAVVHGTLWAGESGRVMRDPTASQPAHSHRDAVQLLASRPRLAGRPAPGVSA